MSMGALLLAGGAKGKRMALPNAKILIHQVSSGFQGQATDIEIHAREILDLRKRLDQIIAEHTGQPIEKVARDTERDYFMTAEEAKEYGIIDRGHRATAKIAEDGTRPPTPTNSCSARFCGKSQRQVKKLIAGPGVYICDECIDLCNEIIDEELTDPGPARPREPAPAEGDLRRPERLRGRAGRGQADAVGGGLQPLQARPDGAARARATSSCRSPTSCCSARPAAARRCSRRRSRGS